MDIEVEEVIDNGDGSATLKLNMDSEATQMLLSFAILEAIKNSINMQKNKTDNYADDSLSSIVYGNKD